MLARCAARFNKVAAAGQPAAASFTKIPFQRENPDAIAREVPAFSMYEFKDGETSPFGEVYMTHAATDVSGASKAPAYEWEFSQLENGLKVASADRNGAVSNVGLFVNVGCRHETPEWVGASHMLEMLAFRSTAHLSHLRTAKTFEQMGALPSARANREHLQYSVRALREYLPLVVPMLLGNVIFPRLLPWELDAASNKFAAAQLELESNPDELSQELLHQAAYHKNTLGNALLATQAAKKANYQGDRLREFMMKHCSPDRMALVGCNVDHKELGKWAMRSFAEYNAIPHSERAEAKAQYTGGYMERSLDDGSDMTHVSLGYEVPGGWNGKLNVQTAVLQQLLGGGGSFSTGGPGKGMHSRIFRDVLSQHGNIDSLVAFSSGYSDSGLFGLHGVCPSAHAKQLGGVMKVTLQGLASKAPTAEEVERAKRSLKGAVHMNMEDTEVAVEDVGRQLMMSGKASSSAEFAAMIDAVKPADLTAAAKTILSSKPTVVVVGNTSNAPHVSDF